MSCYVTFVIFPLILSMKFSTMQLFKDEINAKGRLPTILGELYTKSELDRSRKAQELKINRKNVASNRCHS